MSNARRPILTTLVTLCMVTGGLLLTGAPALAAGARSVVGSFGPGGPKSGVFEELQSIAVEQSTGDVFVYQAGNSGRVYKFNAAGDEEDFSSTGTNELKSVGGGAGESEIAVDNSSGPDKSDIYVATGEKLEIYTSAGKKETSLTTKEEPCGVAVDPSGAVYVAFKEENTIRKYIPVMNPVKASNYRSSLSGVDGVCDIAVDSAGDVYAAKTSGGVTRYEASEFNTLLLTAIGTAVDAEGVTLALDPSSGGDGGELYVDETADIAEYTPPATRVASFGSLAGSYGVAEDHASGEVYAAEEEEGKVAIFGPSSEYPLTVRRPGWGSGTVECSVGGGAAEACAGEYPKGAVVTLTATPGSGSEFKGFSEACTNSSGPCEVTIDAARSVTATFALEGVAEHTLTVSPTGAGSVSAKTGAISNCSSGGGVCEGSYPEGAEVPLEARPGQYQKVEWKDCTSEPSENVCIVKMGAADASVSAIFAAKSRTVTVTLAGSGSGSVSATTGAIKDCAITKGSPSGGTCSGPYPETGEVELEATPAAGSTVKWSGCGENPITKPDDCFVKPASGAVTVTATFTPKTHTLTVTPAGSGSGSVSASEGEIKGCAISKGVPGGGTCSGPYDEGATVTLEATRAEGSTVTWSANCTSLVEDTCTVDVEAANVTVTATFTAAGVTEYELKVVKAGSAAGTGLVTSSPAGIECGATCEASYEAGKKVTLTEKPEGSTFAGWSGGGCTGTAETCAVTISAAETVTATFNTTAVTEYELKVVKAGSAASTGLVTSSPAGIECGATCEASYEAGKKVTLTEKPEGSTFAGWSGGGCTGTAETCAVTISAAETVTATFNEAGHGTAHEFLFSFGPEGRGLGLFEEPSSVAVEQSSGDVYVYENELEEEGEGKGSRIYKFNASGEPVDFASPATTNVIEHVAVGQESGQIAVDSSSGPDNGDIYLATGSELKIYGPEGVKLGTLPGVEPYGVAVGASGEVYVSFYGEEEVKEYVPVANPVTSADYVSSLWNVEHAFGIAVDSGGDIYAEFTEYVAPNVVSGVRGYDPLQFSVSEKTAAPDLEFHNKAETYEDGLAVDSSGDVFIKESPRGGYGGDIAEYTPSGTLVGTFGEAGAGKLTSESHGVAVSEASGDVYAARGDGNQGEVNVYSGSSEVVLPVAKVEGVTQLLARSATLNGTVNPKETEVTACEFEYGTSTSYGQSEACSKAVPFSGDSPEPVSASVTGLQPDTTYYYRLSAANASGSGEGMGHFTTPPAGPGIAGESVTGVSSTGAELRAQIDPRGVATSYYFQYGTSESYGASVPAPPGAAVGSGEADLGVLQQAQGLAPGTTYHYRVVGVQGPEGSEVSYYGADHTFTTQAAGAGFALPDGRQWEMVSPPDKDGAEPQVFTPWGGVLQASADGDAITYGADGPMPAEAQIEGARGLEAAQILSIRGAQGWQSQDIATPNTSNRVSGIKIGGTPEYYVFSSDLALALLEPFPGTGDSGSLAEPPLSPPLSPAEAGHQEKTIYLRDDAPLQPQASEAASYEAAKRNGEALRNPGFRALVTKANAPREANAPGGEPFGGGRGERNEGLEVAGATPDLGHVVFRSRRAAPGLYEWGPGGSVQLISALPADEGEGRVEAVLGAQVEEDIRHAISNDGRLVFWTYNHHLYVRDTQSEETLRLDTPLAGAPAEGPNNEPNAVFQTASADGSRVFFTDTQRLTEGSKAGTVDEEEAPDLYEVELSGGSGPGSPLSGRLSDLTEEGVHPGEAADVLGYVLGASEDGSYVYFVANGALTGEATRGDCDPDENPRPSGTTCNLYAEHYDGTGWTRKLIAALSDEDAPDWGAGGVKNQTSRVSADGEYLAFMSDRSLTGYDNEDVSSEHEGERLDEEVYRYDAGDAERPLVCVSCDPSGARPQGVYDKPVDGIENSELLVDRIDIWAVKHPEPQPGEADPWLAGSVPGWVPVDNELTFVFYQPRYLLDNGRLFFDSPDRLVPAATGAKESVYEYEPEGVGSCASPAGCVGLISSPRAEHESVFMDASESGNDVFFLTAEPLVAQDLDSNFDVYDAHVCEASSPCPSAPPPSSPPCQETPELPCKGAASSAPAFTAPASGSPSGAGNVAQPPSKPPASAKGLTRAQKLAKALKACKKDRKKKKRLACEKTARKRYAPKKKSAKHKRHKQRKKKGSGKGSGA